MALPDKFGWEAKLKALAVAKVNVPKILANDGQRWFLSQFDKQEFAGIKWTPRKDRKNTKALLVNTGNLRSSVANSIRESNWKRIRWSSGVDYAGYQKFGTDDIPARNFIAGDVMLFKIFNKKIDLMVKDIFKKR